jgi:hypothetical protein
LTKITKDIFYLLLVKIAFEVEYTFIKFIRMRRSPEDYILKFIVPLKEMFEEGTRFLQERTGPKGCSIVLCKILRRTALIKFLLFYSETEID